MRRITSVSRLLLAAFVLTACLAGTGIAAGEPESAGNETDQDSGHETTTVDTDGTVSGFTLGAGLVAVLLGGGYQVLWA